MKLDRILLVDDSVPSNFLTKMVLRDAGIVCRVDEALNGKEALEFIDGQTECPSAILLDINMPVMDGHEFLKKFENEKSCAGLTKIFMITSSIREEDREYALRSPLVKGYFEKPLTKDHLQQVEKCFDSKD